MPKDKPPALGKTLLDSINASLRELHDLQHDIPRAEACGVDCQEARARREHLITELEAIKREYYPGGK